ncbi:MAG: PEGA domain-containing protein [Methanoregula sp.]|nr:PEGA domain-containing protein [Methanoregula sp.]
MEKYTIAISICLLCIILLGGAQATGESTTCALTVQSIPDRVAVSIDGTLIGVTPLSGYELSCGNHTILVSGNGYADFVAEKTLERGNPEVVIANLQRLDDRGTVYITSDPPGGNLYIDGTLKGNTPLLIDALTPGPHAALIRKTNYEDYTDTITADPGRIPEYHESLIPLPQTGFLGIVSVPDNATAYIDGTVFGTTPTMLLRVSAGTHQLIVRKHGYWNYTQTLEIAGGSSGLVQADLEKIPDDGTLIVDSAPTGASVYLNGTYKTVTPVTFENIPAGNYTLEFRKLNYTSQNITFTLNGGETREVYAGLTNDPTDTIQPFMQIYHEGQSTDGDLTGSEPAGSVIGKSYQWYARGHFQFITLHIPESLYMYYKSQPHFTNITSLKRYTLSDEDRVYLHNLIGQLKDTSGNKNLAARNDYHNVVAFVQGIPYALHTDPATGQTSTAANDYWKYPVETLAEGNGDCIDDAILAGALLKEMNYDVAIILLPQTGSNTEGHAVVGIACDNCNGYYYPVDGRNYYYLDLTASGLPLGSMSYPGQADTYAHTAAQVFVL